MINIYKLPEIGLSSSVTVAGDTNTYLEPRALPLAKVVMGFVGRDFWAETGIVFGGTTVMLVTTFLVGSLLADWVGLGMVTSLTVMGLSERDTKLSTSC